ncbi:gluconolactonase (plasmid) [Pseudonocardia sp. EC080610-09]|uniref:SMP-30/gluconolactonase/LRE family protein n=1 Tax=unclassified Pseudonocardia TaxID=2619320 RepID=UPI000706280D|nr:MULTISPECIES: SMP-30/gluconolactonase/LRE family protein [unclassified Pseudonocardia]ALL79355.1 gluconolactonase [Pseudonocardia sp. EC080610-09]ALL85327.1 gluconolactonase [Pseudonocardia sp. EC080619-01]
MAELQPDPRAHRPNPLDGFSLTGDDIDHVGFDLQRPECILAEPDGTLWSADARGGVMRIDPSGEQRLITQADFAESALTENNVAHRLIDGTLPNGLAFDRDGSFLISNFGTDRLERMTRDGTTTVIADSLDGAPIGKVNFVCRDSEDRVWVTVSTKAHDWGATMTPDIADGQLLLHDGKRLRAVADGLAFANECKLDADETHIYVVQTCGRNVLRFPINDDGTLGEREIYGPADHGRFIDGIAFDAFGNLWGTYIFTDGIFAITPEREVRLILDDSTPEEVARFDDRFQRGAIDMEFLLGTGGPVATWCASVTFGGPDLREVYLGNLRQSRIPHFRSPVAGLPLVHWSETIAR